MRDGQVVKGVRFRDHRVVGDILDLALRYRDEGADELVFYDIAASPEGRSVDRSWVRRVARLLDIPFCVAGGIGCVADAEQVLAAGAEKISVNSPALADPELIDALSERFGAQCVVVGIDSQTVGNAYRVQQFTGDPDRTRDTARSTLEWVLEVQRRGAGEIVLNCMASDGVRQGYDIVQLCAVRGICRVPLVASGGAGSAQHFSEVFRAAEVDAALAASVFHSGAISIPELKRQLARRRHRGESMTTVDETGLEELDWDKGAGLLPAIVQDADTGAVLMLAYMNREALAATRESGRVTFWSRSKQRLWTKGETSGNYLEAARHRRRLRRRCLVDSGAALGPRLPSWNGAPASARGRRARPQNHRLPRYAAARHRAADRGAAAWQLHRQAVGRRAPAHRAEGRRGRPGTRPRQRGRVQ